MFTGYAAFLDALGFTSLVSSDHEMLALALEQPWPARLAQGLRTLGTDLLDWWCRLFGYTSCSNLSALEGLILTAVAVGAVLGGLFLWAVLMDAIAGIPARLQSFRDALIPPPMPGSAPQPKWARFCGQIAFVGWIIIGGGLLFIVGVAALNMAAIK
jgi:hypothetical protein